MNVASKKSYGRIDQFVLGWTDKIIQCRWLVLPLTLAMVFFIAGGASRLGFANNYRVFFGDNNPELIAFEEFQATYTKNDNILFVVQPKSMQVFQAHVTAAIEDITERAWQIPYNIRVDSISNFQHSWSNEDDLTVEDLLRDSAEYDESALQQKKAIALAEPLLKNNLIDPHADTTGINVTIQFPELDPMEVMESSTAARAIAEEVRAAYPDLTIAVSGVAMMNAAFAESGQKDLQTLVPIMYAVLIAVMIFALRSFWGTVTTLFIIGFSAASAMGMAGYFGIPLTPISVTAPTIILTLAIADSIHILVTFLKRMRRGDSKLDALRESMRVNALPVTVTSITTIVGFLGLNFTDTPPFWHLGNITAMGIGFAWWYSMSFLPALVSILPFRTKVRSDAAADEERGVIAWISTRVTKNYKAVGLVSGVSAVILAALIPTIELNDEWIKYFDHRVSFRNDAEFAMDHLSGLYLIEFSLDAAEPGGVSDPSYLQHLETFANWLRDQPETIHVYSYTDIMKRLNKNMHGDDEAYYRLPEDRDLAAQYLLLYELSLPFGLDMNDRINVDKSATRISVTLPEVSTVGVRDYIQRCRDWLKENNPPGYTADPTSATVMFSYISQRNIQSMLKGNALALFMISVIMIIALRSWKLGLLSLIPNTLPILVAFGVWAILVGQVGMAAATIVSTSLGIVVDDTVHFLSKYIRARREQDLGAIPAVQYAFHTVGPAILVTTIILALGFSVLSTSTFLINSQMGLMTSISILVALVYDFTLLPALLILIAKNKGEHHVEESIA